MRPLTPSFTHFVTDFEKKTDCFAVYGAPKGSDSFQLLFISDRWWILTVWVCFVLYKRIGFVTAKEKNTYSGLSRLRVSGIMTLSIPQVSSTPPQVFMKAFIRKREIPTFKRPKDSAYVKPYSFFFLFHGPCQQLRFWGICDIGQIQFSRSFAWSNCLACRLNKWLIFYHTKCAENFLSFLNVKITSRDRYLPKNDEKLRQRFVLESAAILLATLVTNLQTVTLANKNERERQNGPIRASHFAFTVSSLKNV